MNGTALRRLRTSWFAAWTSELFALLSACVFAALMLWIYQAVAHAAHFQEQVRAAQIARGGALKAQLDMETGMRGYTSTGLELFLEPYRISAPRLAGHLADSKRTLEALDGAIPAGVLARVDDQRTVAGTWQATVVAPLLDDRERPDAARLQLRGKQLIDRFRADSDAIAAALSDASTVAAAELTLTLRRIAIVGLVGLIALFVLVRAFGVRNRRLWSTLERQRLLYEAEKRIANRLQTAFLQHALPTVASIEIHAVYMPAETEARVGGDWFDALTLPDGNIFVSVGDVCGHGIEAAVTMSRAREAMLVAALTEVEPSTVLERVNQVLLLRGETMVTAVCGFVDLARSEFRYAAAGHPSPILGRPGSAAEFLRHGGLPMGIIADVAYTTLHETIAPGSLLVLYTDGLTEYARDPIGAEERLLASVAAVVSSGAADPAARIRDTLFDGAQPVDDVAVLTLSFGTPSLTPSTAPILAARA